MGNTINLTTISIETSMGSVTSNSESKLTFLTETELINLSTIGYSGKLNGAPETFQSYLNSLGKGTFQVTQTKHDNGDFRERFTIVRAF
jgi:hypothetical protein